MAPRRSWLSLAVLATGLLSVAPVGTYAQTTTATCLSSFDWTDNSKNQNPCLIAAYLQGACNGGEFTVDALPTGTHYTGPYADQQNQCQCSSVTYNTVSACGACQNHTFVSWSTWNFNCTTVYPGVFPPGVPDGTAVPQWAFQDVTSSDIFNLTLAQTVGDNPESTGTHAQSTGSVNPTSTTSSASLTPAPTTTNGSTSGSGTNTGAIAGGVVGGVVGVALIAGAAIFFWRRKRSQVPSSGQSLIGPTSPTSAFTDPVPTQMAQPRLYDPSDPSTFPTSPATATTGLSSGQGPATNYSTYSVQPSGHYSGVPEI